MPAPFNFVTVLRSGGCYTSDHAHRLARQLREYVEDFDRVYCLTDLPLESFDLKLIQPVPLCYPWPGWWAKLNLFSNAYLATIGTGGRPVFYLDLDTLIVSPLDTFLHDVLREVKGMDMVVLGDLSGKQRHASGLMAWKPGALHEAMFLKFVQDAETIMRECADGGDQRWIGEHLTDVGARVPWFQDIDENAVASYKWHAQFAVPRGCSIVCFHGRPRPHEVTKGWAGHHWRRYSDDVTRNVVKR